MVDKVRDIRSADELNKRVGSDTRVIFESPKSEPNLESAFIFPRIGDDQQELQAGSDDRRHTVVLSSIPTYK